jgi:glycosyltransferase involved in cell wall biosynthesis
MDLPEHAGNKVPELSVVVLCYRSGELARDFVANVITSFEKNAISDFEVVLVGNYHAGQHDDTPEVLRKLAREDSRITFVADPKPKGGMMGWDMRSGLRRARGKFIAVIDGDGQMPVDDLVRVFFKIKGEDLDLVKTYRIRRGDSYLRKIMSLGYNAFFKLLFPGFRSSDINSKPKIVKREKFDLLDLKNNGWCVDAEIMIQARRLKFMVGEIPTTFLGLRGTRKSFVRLSAVIEFIRFLLAYRVEEWLKKA